MLKRGEDATFEVEALVGGGRGEFGSEEFEGDGASNGFDLFREVDFAEAAASEQSLDPVAVDDAWGVGIGGFGQEIDVIGRGGRAEEVFDLLAKRGVRAAVFIEVAASSFVIVELGGGMKEFVEFGWWAHVDYPPGVAVESGIDGGCGGMVNGIVEPGAGEAPPSFGGGPGAAEGIGGVSDGESEVDAEADEFGGFGVVSHEPLQGVVEGEPVVWSGVHGLFRGGIQSEGAFAMTTSGRGSGAGAIDQGSSHGFRGGGEEVSAVVPVRGGIGIVAAEPEVGFVDEAGGIEREIAVFTVESCLGETSEFGVHLMEEGVGGTGAGGGAVHD